jgi:hypothetical protein
LKIVADGVVLRCIFLAKKESNMDEEKLRELAVRWVCPLCGNPQDGYEKRMVDQLIRFGRAVLQSAQQSVQADKEYCVCDEGVKSMQPGRFCLLCGLQRY